MSQPAIQSSARAPSRAALKLVVTPLTPVIGAEINSVDLNQRLDVAAAPSQQDFRRVLHAAPAPPDWSARAIPTEIIDQLHALLALGPTLVDASPTRVLFVTSQAGKGRLSAYLGDSIRDEALAAPACALIGYDIDFAEQLVEFLPRGRAGKTCLENPEVVREMAARNGMLQGAYLIVAARSLGLEASVLFDFDVTGASFEFFRGERVRANFLCALGYPAVA